MTPRTAVEAAAIALASVAWDYASDRGNPPDAVLLSYKGIRDGVGAVLTAHCEALEAERDAHERTTALLHETERRLDEVAREREAIRAAALNLADRLDETRKRSRIDIAAQIRRAVTGAAND